MAKKGKISVWLQYDPNSKISGLLVSLFGLRGAKRIDCDRLIFDRMAGLVFCLRESEDGTKEDWGHGAPLGCYVAHTQHHGYATDFKKKKEEMIEMSKAIPENVPPPIMQFGGNHEEEQEKKGYA